MAAAHIETQVRKGFDESGMPGVVVAQKYDIQRVVH
jgi:hypothetical protein